jgi:predicted RNA-binding protein with PUA-like domain
MWLLKTEPGTYSYADLERDERTRWDGVANPAALKNLRAMKVGDEALIYHTGGERAAVGLCRVTKAAYPDPAAGDPKRVVIDIEARGALAQPVTLDAIKQLASFAGSPLVRQGRLSVVPLNATQWKAILTRGGR